MLDSFACSTPATPLFATLGVFDGVHLGHRSVIERVKEEAIRLQWSSGVISFAPHPRQVLRPELPLSLLTSPQERVALLHQTDVDRVILLDFTLTLAQLSAQEFLQLLSSQYGVKGLLIGYDHRFGHNRAEGFEQYVEYGRELDMEILRADELVTPQGAVSSSIIRQHLLQGELSIANQLLGYSYTLQGEVIAGYQVGRTLGFPTANLAIHDATKLIPAHGVYAVRVLLPDGSRYGGMLNIGNRPTLNRPNDYSIEVHLFDYTGDLYNTQLTIELIDYIRPEQTFPHVEALKAQLAQDRIEIQYRLTL